MVLRRSASAPIRQEAVPQLPTAGPDLRSLTAAAAQIQLDTGSVWRTRVTDEDWQREGWRHYDINGELRFASNRHAAALSQVRIYVADVDDRGGPGEETTDEKLQQLGETLFGGPAAKAEALRTLGVCFYIGGEAYIVAEGATNPKSDVWYIVTANQIKKTGSAYEVKRPAVHGGGKAVLQPRKDLLMRAWTPHPRNQDIADSPTRSVLPTLREIERLTQLTFSQIDSRLLSAGLLLFPQGTSFPKADGTPGNLNDLMAMVMEVAKAQLQGAGTAAGVVPIFAEVPVDAAQRPEHLTFDTPIQGELKEKLEQAIHRLAVGLDLDPNELLGQGSANHWGAWQIEESGIKLFINPVMTRVCDALTQGYLYPALRAMGVKDPEKFTLWYDTSPLTVRPNRFEDANLLYDKGLLDGSAVLQAGNFSDESKPKAAELAAQRAWEAIKLDPALLQQEAYAKLVGLPVSEPVQPPVTDPVTGLPMSPEEVEAAKAQGRDGAIGEQMGLPGTESGGASPAQQGLTAAAGVLPAAEQLVLRALEMAGGRLLDRRTRGQYGSVPRHELHTHVRPTDRVHARRLLEGAFTHAPVMVRHFSHVKAYTGLQALLEEYCVELLVRGYAHETALLEASLDAAARGVTRDYAAA